MEFAIPQPKVVWLSRNEKQTYRLNCRPQMWPMGLTLTITLTFEFSRSNMTLTFGHTHGLDQGFSWSNFEIAVSQNGRADIGGWSRSFMTMAVTIWWPRSGVRIYQIVTGVTSDVGMPSTHLVAFPALDTCVWHIGPQLSVSLFLCSMLITYLVLLVKFRPSGSYINSIVNFTLAQFLGNMSDHLQNWKPGPPHIPVCVLFHCCGLTLITAWISNYIHYEMWDEITYPPPNSQHCSRAAIEGWNG